MRAFFCRCFLKMIYTESLPIAPVTVEEVKAHLRIDDDIEDALLEQYILSATQEAEQILEREIIFRKDPKALSKDIENVPPTVKQYIYCMVGDMYAHRELSDVSQLQTFHKHLLDPYILYYREDEVNK